MSPVLRVGTRPEAPQDGVPATPPVPWRVRLRLDELVLAARLAGDVPLPVDVGRHGAAAGGAEGGADGGADGGQRLSHRLAGTPLSEAHGLLAAALARVDDDGPTGARASLTGRELLDGDTVAPALAAALAVLATGPLGVLLDVAAVRGSGTSRLRSWFGVRSGLVAQLSTGDGLDYELAWFDPRLWVSQVARAATVTPLATGTPRPLPDYVSLPSELLVGSEKAFREQRSDLVPVMAATHAGRVRLGEPGEVREADGQEVASLLTTLGRACRGRLRLVTLRRDREEPPALTTWLLFDDGWHELRPGRRATSVLRRRRPADLGLVTLPIAAAVGDQR